MRQGAKDYNAVAAPGFGSVLDYDAAQHAYDLNKADKPVYLTAKWQEQKLVYFDTEYTLREFNALWQFGTLENDRLYILPPQGFAAWLQRRRGMDIMAPVNWYLAEAGYLHWRVTSRMLSQSKAGIAIPFTPPEVAYIKAIGASSSPSYLVKPEVALRAWDRLSNPVLV